MESGFFRMRGSVIYRPVQDELIVVDTESGKFFHFSLSSKEMLDFFQEPRSVRSYLELCESSKSDEEISHLNDLCGQLEQHHIFERVSSGDVSLSPPQPRSQYVRPEFLKVGEVGLDDVAFLYP